MSDVACGSSLPPFTWCITIVLKGRCSHIPCFNGLCSLLLLYRDVVPMSNITFVSHPDRSVHHITMRTDAFLKLLLFVTISVPKHPLYIGFTALLGIAIAIFEVFICFLSEENAHHVLLSQEQQFQFISFQTCFHSVMEWKPIHWKVHKLIFWQKNKATLRFWLEKWQILTPLRKEVLALRSALLCNLLQVDTPLWSTSGRKIKKYLASFSHTLNAEGP